MHHLCLCLSLSVFVYLCLCHCLSFSVFVCLYLISKDSCKTWVMPMFHLHLELCTSTISRTSFSEVTSIKVTWNQFLNMRRSCPTTSTSIHTITHLSAAVATHWTAWFFTTHNCQPRYQVKFSNSILLEDTLQKPWTILVHLTLPVPIKLFIISWYVKYVFTCHGHSCPP